MGKSNAQRNAESIQREELADQLRRIIQRGKMIKNNKARLRISYDRWYTINRDAIESLTRLMDQVLKVNTVANAVSSAATVAEIIGGILCIAGAISDKPDLTETGNKFTKGGVFVNAGTSAVHSGLLKDLCQSASRKVKENKKYTDALEKERYSYFQELQGFKTELRKAELNDTLPTLLESARREGIDFLGDLDIDEDTKSRLRTNIRRMCRSNAKKIKATTQMGRTQDAGRIFAANIRVLLIEFKHLIDDDSSLFSIFSEETKKFLHENVESSFPVLDAAESWLEESSIESALRGGLNLYGMSSAISSASRVEIGMMSGCRVFQNFVDLTKTISDIENGSKSEESEELGERIEEMKTMRKNIVEAMKRNFGWLVPRSESPSCPALTY